MGPGTLMIVLAVLGAGLALIAAVGKLSGRLADVLVDRLYYVSYACTGVSVVLFVAWGFGAR